MANKALIIGSQGTHPVRAGSQVRTNLLIHHLCIDLDWKVDYFCPAGILRPESWGPNMDYLRAIYIPRKIDAPVANRSSRPKLMHIRKALSGGLIQTIVWELRDLRSNIRGRMKKAAPVEPFKGYEILSHMNKGSKTAENLWKRNVHWRVQLAHV